MTLTKEKKLLVLPLLALVAIIAWAILGDAKNTNAMSATVWDSITIDVDAPTISLKVDEEASYICLSSAEYGQAYLPDEFQCHQCIRSEATTAALDAPWNENRPLLISKLGDEIRASEIDVSSISDHRISTWYKNISYYPEKAQGMSQCTSNTNVLATCYQTENGCLFMFQEQIQ